MCNMHLNENLLVGPTNNKCNILEKVFMIPTPDQREILQIRLSVLALVVESQKSTALFTHWELEFLKKYLYYNITTQTASTRKQMIATYKRAFTRVKEGLAVLNRTIRSKKRTQSSLTSEESAEIAPNNDLAAEQSASAQRSLEENIALLNLDAEEDFQSQLTAELSEAVRNKTIYEHFLTHVLRECLLPGLLADANYPRRSTSLELLLFYVQAFPENQQLCFSDDMNTLRYAVMNDSYESNKEMVVSLFKQFSPSQLPFKRENALYEIKVCLTLASSIKPNQTLSAAYTMEICLLSPIIHDGLRSLLGAEYVEENPLLGLVTLLVRELQKRFIKCLKDTSAAARSVSMYGILFSIRHLVQKNDISKSLTDWSRIFTDLVCLCFDMYAYVSPLVNNQSPEGNLPDENDVIAENGTNESAKAQMILVFAWRSVKDISLFLGDVASLAILFEKKLDLVSSDLLISIGDFFTGLFIQAKHRGVFEQAYVGFRKVCEGFWKSEKKKLAKLPEYWLSRILNVLSADIDETCEHLCATRRSAGLPFLILAILTTEPQTRANKTFHDSMRVLLKTANNLFLANSERRTHCMNVLRAVFRNNELGELVQQYAAEGMIAAITGFKSTTWGIRNSATLLFSSLMTRIFGVQRTKDSDTLSIKNRMTAKVFFMRYSKLHTFLLQELSEGSMNNSLSLHPILLILSRLYPSNFEEESEVKLEEYLPFITKCLSNPVYRTRELAAKASIPLISSQEILYHIAQLLILLSNVNLKNNECQGLLFQLMYLLKNVPNDRQGINIPKLVQPTFWILVCAGKYITYNVAAIYIEVIVLLVSVFRKNCEHHQSFQTLIEIIEWHLRTEVKALIGNAKQFIVNLHYLKLYLTATVLEHRDLFVTYAADEILLNLSEQNNSIRKFYLNIIHYLNCTRSSYVQHSLYVTEDLEISEKEHKIVEALEPHYRKILLKHIHVNIRMAYIGNMHDFFNSAECRLPAFMVLRHYPCILNDIQPSELYVLNYLVNYCNCDNEELTSAVISCISVFLKKLDSESRQLYDYTGLMHVLIASASPAAAVHRRLATCDFILDHASLIFTRETCFTVRELCELWSITLVLLEDEEQIVRDTISQLAIKTSETTSVTVKIGMPMISERAREELLLQTTDVLPFKACNRFLLMWSLRHKENDVLDDSDDVSDVFDKGYLNSFAETTPVVKVTVKVLKESLWTVEECLSYEDKSIFFEEQALLLTTILFNTSVPHISALARSTTLAMRYTLTKIAEYLENHRINCPDLKSGFRKLMVKEQTNGRFSKLVNEIDRNNLRLFFWTIYSPIISQDV